MKLVNFAIAALFLPFFAQPGMAQGNVSDAYAVVKAVRDRDGNKLNELLRARPNVINARDDKGETALIVAISRRDQDFTEFLLSRGADPTIAARNGDTPLIMAARVGYLEAAQYVLKMRAPVDAANRMGETALIVAVQQRHLDLADLLLDLGANPDKTDNAAGLSARDYAKRDGRSREILARIEAATKKPAAKKFDPPKDPGDFTIK